MAEEEKPTESKNFQIPQDFIEMLLCINETLAQLEIIKANLTEVKKRLEKTYWKAIK